MNIDEAIRALRIYIQSAKVNLLSANVSVDREVVYEMIDNIEKAIPEDIRQARWIIKEQDAILDKAEREAQSRLDDAQATFEQLEQTTLRKRERAIEDAQIDIQRMYDDAKEKCDFLVEESEIMRLAERKADVLIDSARQESKKIRLELDKFIEEVMASFETELHNQLGKIDEMRDKFLPDFVQKEEYATEEDLVGEVVELDARYEGDDEERYDLEHAQPVDYVDGAPQPYEKPDNVIDGMAPQRRPKRQPPEAPHKPDVHRSKRRGWLSQDDTDHTNSPNHSDAPTDE